MRVRDDLRLFPDYGAESPVWSRRGNIPFRRLSISDELRSDLIGWRDEALEPSHQVPRRTEEEWEAAGRLLAVRLAKETGCAVHLEP